MDISPRVTASVAQQKHFFTIDVEEYFCAAALAAYAPTTRWNTLESRVGHSINALLELMERHHATGTFFTVGWVAERHPEMMRRIVAAGHEVASHTYDHARVSTQTPRSFRESVRRAKDILESITGYEVLGFRAPSFSISRGMEWALDVLIEEGHLYDSSLFPVRRPGYGYADGERDPHWIVRPVGRIMEYPPATLRVMGMTLPAAGGAYFRLLPQRLVHAALESSEARGEPGTFYSHPWEWDPGQPRFGVTMATRIRHYGGQRGLLGRLDQLLQRFEFTSIRPTILRASRRDDQASWSPPIREFAMSHTPGGPDR